MHVATRFQPIFNNIETIVCACWEQNDSDGFSANTTYRPSACLLSGHRLRRWPDRKQTQVQHDLLVCLKLLYMGL